jgi:hypothetical protein
MFEHPLFIAFIAAVIGFLLKYAWDRWLSQTSRVTRSEFLTAIDHWAKECEIRRNGCLAIRAANKDYFERMINEQSNCYEEAQRVKVEEDELFHRRRAETRKALVLIMMTQIKICEALRLDCTDLGKMLVEMGAVSD